MRPVSSVRIGDGVRLVYGGLYAPEVNCRYVGLGARSPPPDRSWNIPIGRAMRAKRANRSYGRPGRGLGAGVGRPVLAPCSRVTADELVGKCTRCSTGTVSLGTLPPCSGSFEHRMGYPDQLVRDASRRRLAQPALSMLPLLSEVFGAGGHGPPYRPSPGQ